MINLNDKFTRQYMLFKAGDKVRAMNVPSLGNNTYIVLMVRRRGKYQDLLLREGWYHSKFFEKV